MIEYTITSNNLKILDFWIVTPKVGYKRATELYYSMPWEKWADKLRKVSR